MSSSNFQLTIFDIFHTDQSLEGNALDWIDHRSQPNQLTEFVNLIQGYHR